MSAQKPEWQAAKRRLSFVPRPYYSTVLERSADDVWAVIRDFGNYAWAGVSGETLIEDGELGDAVGAVRSVRTSERHIRQRLLSWNGGRPSTASRKRCSAGRPG